MIFNIQRLNHAKDQQFCELQCLSMSMLILFDIVTACGHGY
jgi:hypothetical protein